MNLEDHWGDIISKARTAANVSAEDAARAAGLGLDEFAELEETGRCAKRPDFQALAAKIGLDGAKLEGIARGWLPQRRDPGSWRELRQIITAGPSYKVNCYLVWDEVTREAALLKQYVTQSALSVTDDALQVLGGHGYIRDHPVELWLRNARGFATFDGLAIV